MSSDEGVRLQKVLATAGVGSRRKCEELIAEGRVTVDGEVAELGRRVRIEDVEIHVDGARVNLRPDLKYFALNKPAGVVTTMLDPHGRTAVGHLVRDRPERLFHVGRLDTDTEGLLIMTNDGDFAQLLAHPSHGIVKTYVAEVPGPIPKALGRRLMEGVVLEDGPVKLDGFRVLSTSGERALVEVSLHEGRNRIVRRLLESVGHPVQRLVRTTIGPVKLGDLGSGQLRELTTKELGELYRELGL